MYGVHSTVSGMNGIRTAGDLVARAQFSKKLKITKAKEYVSKKLGVNVLDLCDEHTMANIRTKLGLGSLGEFEKTPRGIDAKLNIEQVLDLPISSCEMHRMLSNKC